MEFSPPVKIQSKQDGDTMNTIEEYSLVLAPFQKQTQIEFVNIKIKETAIRYLTVINPFDHPRQVFFFFYFLFEYHIILIKIILIILSIFSVCVTPSQ